MSHRGVSAHSSSRPAGTCHPDDWRVLLYWGSVGTCPDFKRNFFKVIREEPRAWLPDVTIWDFSLKQESVLFSSLGFSALSRLAERPHNAGKKVTRDRLRAQCRCHGYCLALRTDQGWRWTGLCAVLWQSRLMGHMTDSSVNTWALSTVWIRFWFLFNPVKNTCMRVLFVSQLAF